MALSLPIHKQTQLLLHLPKYSCLSLLLAPEVKIVLVMFEKLLIIPLGPSPCPPFLPALPPQKKQQNRTSRQRRKKASLLTAACSVVPEKHLLPVGHSHSDTHCWPGHCPYCEVFTVVLASCIAGGLVNTGEHSGEYDSTLFTVTIAEQHCYCNKIDFVNGTDTQILTAWKKALGVCPLHKNTQTSNFCVDTWWAREYWKFLGMWVDNDVFEFKQNAPLQN